MARSVVWIYQPPRSGGSLLLRLFDGHPHFAVHPEPVNLRWNRRVTDEKILDKFSMEKFRDHGFTKKSSNRHQTSVPISFDTDTFVTTYLEHRTPGDARSKYDAAQFARFRAWDDYRNATKRKRFFMLHTAMWSRMPIGRAIDNFFQIYPDGFHVFVARKPSDWLASAISLDGEPRLNDLDAALTEFNAVRTSFLSQLNERADQRILVIHFDAMVIQPKSSLGLLCRHLDVRYRRSMRRTTINGNLTDANSTHAGRSTFSPDPSLIDRGAGLHDWLQDDPRYVEAMELHRALLQHACIR